MPLWQGSPMDHIWPENEVGQIIGVHPPEIGAPVTPGMSHGTKIFASKFFSYHKNKMLFYALFPFIMQKYAVFFNDFELFLQNKIHKTHKITSFEDDMRKFLSQKFWSHGTSLGSLGPLSQGDVHPGFSRPQFLVIWGPYNYPGIVACLVQAENPKLTYSLVWGLSTWRSINCLCICQTDLQCMRFHKIVLLKTELSCCLG